MANEFLDGTYTLVETENSNQFYFYRNDEEVLTDIDREPMDLYHAYIAKKMMNGEIKDMVMKNIRYETSTDGKCIRLTAYDIGEMTDNSNNSTVNQKQPGFLKRLFHKIFG